MDITIFYAWQTDRPEKVNRDLIRAAAMAACERITQDTSNDWRVTLDSDTQGVAGMCDIPNVILKKIRACDIFLGDLTLVGSAVAKPDKLFPNANVVFELGFAARHLSFKSLIGVMNEAYGEFDGQIFDIKRRGCLKYRAKETATDNARQKAQDRLTDKLEGIIRETIETVILPRRKQQEASRNEVAEEAQQEFAERVFGRDFHGFNRLPAVVTSIQFRQRQEMDYERAFEVVQSVGANPKPDGDTIIWPGNFSMTELDVGGRLVHAYGGDYHSVKQMVALNFKGATQDDDFRALLDETVQRNIVYDVYQHCQLLARIGVRPPWRIGVSLVGIKGFRLLTPSQEASPNMCNEDMLHLPLVTVRSVDEVADIRLTGNTLREPLKFLTRKFGWPYNFCFTQAGDWNLR